MRSNVCSCGSGKAQEVCCENSTETRVWMVPFSNDGERLEFLNNLQIGSEFDMRYRGLVEFYGKDFIAYKQEQYFDQDRNDFLRIFSSYMADFLEDDCPPSWKQCTPQFWEEFIVCYIPYFIKVTEDQKQVETFMKQLKSFVKWLDKRAHTWWYKYIINFCKRHRSDLKACEALINHLYLADFPKVFHDDWNYQHDLDLLLETYKDYDATVHSVFEIKKTDQDIALLYDLKTSRSYSIIGLPEKLIRPGILMHGIIGKKDEYIFWDWHHTDNISPLKSKDYIYFE